MANGVKPRYENRTQSNERQNHKMKTIPSFNQINIKQLKLLWLLAALAGDSALNCVASDPNGIYAFVDKVVLEPSEGAPERIQIWGGFALAEGNGYQYAPAERGFMYFKLKPGKESVCRN